MLLLRESHRVVGALEDEFESVMRDEWMPALARDGGSRLLYYTHLVHGAGLSYEVVTYTLLRDATAWGRLVERATDGDLGSLLEKLDGLRHDVAAKQLQPLPWSVAGEIAVEDVPAEPGDHPLGLFMEDTVWPHEGRLEEYVARAGAQYATEFAERSGKAPSLLEIQAAYRTAFGSGQRREVVLWQKVVEPRGLVPLFTREVPAEFKQPGRWMHDALELRDQWQSRLLRTSSWSPWY